jgi:hypothetical protein
LNFTKEIIEFMRNVGWRQRRELRGKGGKIDKEKLNRGRK